MTQLSDNSKAYYDSLEKLRAHMKLRVEDILQIIEVSRPAYYGWRNGRKMNSISSRKALGAISILLKIAKDPEWKKWEGQHLTIWKRKEILDLLLAREVVSH